tara:strand:- start:26584 stop:29376 length:2793 start_codon:yes stop_codon:yes gene_type:complete
MSDTVNHLANQLRKSSWFKASGPVMCSQRYSEAHGQDMIEQRFKVVNGTYIDEGDVPFGSFVTTEEVNTKESWCVVLSTPFVDVGSLPVFKQRCGAVKNIDRWVCAGTECKQIVAKGTGVVSGWSGKVTPIDDKHELLVLITPTSYSTITSNKWDNQLQQNVSVVETVVTSVGTSGANGYVYTEFELVRCGYYIKRVITWAAVDYTVASGKVGKWLCTGSWAYEIDQKSSLNSPATAWDTAITPLKYGAYLQKTLTPATFSTITYKRWDQELLQFVSITETLATVVTGAGALGYTVTDFELLRCGYYVKRVVTWVAKTKAEQYSHPLPHVCAATRDIIIDIAPTAPTGSYWETQTKTIKYDAIRQDTINITTTQAVNSKRWDNALQQDVSVVESLTTTHGTDGSVGKVYTEYELVQCGYYMKREITWVAVTYTVNSGKVGKWVCNGSWVYKVDLRASLTVPTTSWDSSISSLKYGAYLMRYLIPTTFSSITTKKWDRELQQDISVVETMTTSAGLEGAVNKVYTEYELFKCGYYVKRVITWASTTYTTTSGKVDRWVCTGTWTYKIDEKGSLSVPASAWDSSISSLKYGAYIMRYLTPATYSTITKNPWDNELHQYVSAVETVVTTVTPDAVVDYVYVEHELIRCGYYIKRTITWAPASYTETVLNFTEFIDDALVTYNIDLIGSLPAIPLTKVWDAVDRPLSRGAFVRKVITVVGTPNIVTGSGFDDILNDDVKYTETLLDVEPTIGGYTGGNFITWNEVQPGWWVKRSEAIATGLKHTINDTRNYYWPPVLTMATFTTISALNEDDVSYVRRIAANFQLTDSYNGPCKAVTTVKFLASNTAPTVTQLLTDGINHSGLLARFSIPPCLHSQVVVTESISAAHPIYEAKTLVATYTATTVTAWPATVVSEVDVRPYKGGFVETHTTITSP